MISEKIRKNSADYAYIIIGSILLAFATTSILKPNGLITGGITGISIIVDKVFNINYTYVYYVLSLGVLISARIFLSKREAFKILFLAVFFPIVLIFAEKFQLEFINNDTFLASIYFGIIGGLGSGLILKKGFSIGGTDTVAKIIHRRLFPFMSISQILLSIDVSIITVSLFVFDRNIALYAILTQIVFIKAIDIVLFGLGTKKVKIEIISEINNDIKDFILNTIKRGVSSYEITGGYTNTRKEKITTICSPRESMLIRDFIAKRDADAFVSVIPISSVWGKGIGFDSLIDEE